MTNIWLRCEYVCWDSNPGSLIEQLRVTEDRPVICQVWFTELLRGESGLLQEYYPEGPPGLPPSKARRTGQGPGIRRMQPGPSPQSEEMASTLPPGVALSFGGLGSARLRPLERFICIRGGVALHFYW